jgi:hypothetical protein
LVRGDEALSLFDAPKQARSDRRFYVRLPAIMETTMEEEIRKNILMLLDQHRIMTIATLRPDGWPQATTVGYANEGFICSNHET